MGIRIWHQSFTVLADVPPYREALCKRVGELVPAGTVVELHGQIPGTYSTNYPGSDIAYSFLYWLHGLQWIAAAREAEKQGFDAMLIASMSDSMLREIRTIVDIPVVGYGESVFNYARFYGRRVGLLVFIAERQEFWSARVKEWGVEDRFAGVAPAGVTFHDVLAAYDNAERAKRVIETVSESAEKLIRETGADVIVPVEMPLNLLFAREGVSCIGGVTVLDGLATSLCAVETLINLKRTSGMTPSTRGYFNARPDKARVQEALQFYGLENLGSRIPSN